MILHFEVPGPSLYIMVPKLFYGRPYKLLPVKRTQSFTNLDSHYLELQSVPRHYAMQSGVSHNTKEEVENREESGHTISHEVVANTLEEADFEKTVVSFETTKHE